MYLQSMECLWNLYIVAMKVCPDLEVTYFCYNQEHSGKIVKTTVTH